jgi:hypothetical protein
MLQKVTDQKVCAAIFFFEKVIDLVPQKVVWQNVVAQKVGALKMIAIGQKVVRNG